MAGDCLIQPVSQGGELLFDLHHCLSLLLLLLFLGRFRGAVKTKTNFQRYFMIALRAGMMLRRVSTICILIALFLLLPSAQSASKFWTGANSGNFNNAGNWRSEEHTSE